MAESVFSDGASSPPMVKMKIPPGLRPFTSFLSTGSCRDNGTCQMLSHAEMKSYCPGSSHSQMSA